MVRVPRRASYCEASSSATPLLSPSASSESLASPDTMKWTPSAGHLRAYWLGAVVCIGGFLFGYDSGIVGGVLTLSSFQNDYQYTKDEKTRVSSLSVSLQQLGAFVACFIIWPLTDRYGRKKSLMVASFIFCIGAMIQTINTRSLAAFYVARVIAGLGLGAASVVVPMYNSEMAPTELRGRLGSFFQWFYTWGIFTSYWVDYGVKRDYAEISRQWQIPIGLQILFAALLGFGMLTLKESTRWLTKVGRHEEAWESLQWIRADSSEKTQDEMEEIRAAVAMEARQTEGFRLKELLEPANFKALTVAFCVFMAQQATGATAFAYYGPQYFQLLVGDDDEKNLLLTAIFGVIKVVGCGIFVLWFADRFGRRTVLIGGALFMAACQVTTAAVVKNIQPPGDGSVTSAGIATVALIYLFVIAYNFSWGPLPWPYVSEIFTTRIRDPGVAVGVASQWLFNFVFSLTTPYMIDDIGWGTFLLWGLFDLVIAAGTFFFLRETAGLSLEEITHKDLFAGHGATSEERAAKGLDVDDEGYKEPRERRRSTESES